MFQSKICIINHKMLLFCIVGLHLCLGQAQPKLLPGNPLIRTDRISIHWHRGISLSYTRTFCIQASNAIHFFSSLLGKPSKKITVESVSMLIPRWGWGGGSSSQRSQLLRVFSVCSKPTWSALGSPKTNFVFTHKSILHIFCDLFDHQNQPSHL